MARGKPDFHRSSVIEAKYGSDFIPVLVDASGQLYIALTGQQVAISNLPSDYFKDGDGVVASGDVSVNNHPSDYFKKDEAIGSITNNVTVDQQDSDRVLKGTEGANKRYISVDSSGVLLARLKGAYGAVLKDVSVDTDGILLSRLKGAFGGVLKDIAVDTNGKIIGVLQGDDSGTLRTLYVDSSGKLVARIQGVGGGLEPLFVIDDGGDEDIISDWAASYDGLDPELLTQFGKEGQHSMKLGYDSDLNVAEYALWTKNLSIGDLSQYAGMKIYMWIYFSSVDYLKSGAYCLEYRIGSSGTDIYIYHIFSTELQQGWNLLEFDLTSPDSTAGTIDFSAIDYQRIQIREATGNTNDFYVVVDLIAIVKENENAGSLIDLATDKDGLLLNKLVGSYGELHKPVITDRYGHLKVNIAEQDEFSQVSNPYKSGIQNYYKTLTDKAVGDHELLSVTGRGVIMGGILRHLSTGSHRDCKIYTTIDGAEFGQYSFLLLNTYNAVTAWTHIPHELLYDNTNFQYIVAWPQSLVFNESLKIELHEVSGSPNNTYMYLIYALF